MDCLKLQPFQATMFQSHIYSPFFKKHVKAKTAAALLGKLSSDKIPSNVAKFSLVVQIKMEP